MKRQKILSELVVPTMKYRGSMRVHLPAVGLGQKGLVWSAQNRMRGPSVVMVAERLGSRNERGL